MRLDAHKGQQEVLYLFPGLNRAAGEAGLLTPSCTWGAACTLFRGLALLKVIQQVPLCGCCASDAVLQLLSNLTLGGWRGVR